MPDKLLPNIAVQRPGQAIAVPGENRNRTFTVCDWRGNFRNSESRGSVT